MSEEERDVRTCDFCGVKIDWQGCDDRNGRIWECEKCGRLFCEKCFADRFGYDSFFDENLNALKLCCPDCWAGKKQRKKGPLKCYEVTIVRYGCLYVAADCPEEALEIADHQTTDAVSWSDDWKPTDAEEDDSISIKMCVTEKAYE